MKLAGILLLPLISLAPLNAAAQTLCAADSQPVQCGDVINDRTDNGDFAIVSYLCPEGDLVAWPDDLEYRLEVTAPTDVTITLDPSNFDAVLALVPAYIAPLNCDPTHCITGSDVVGTGNEVITASLTPGTYYICVDGSGADMFNYGFFSLTIDCDTGDCEDIDLDGYYGYNAAFCPAGDDCCDAGSESGILGCDPATAPTIHPGAQEICEDGIDQDCDGSDLVCPEEFCQADAAIICGDQVTGDNTGGNTNVTGYLGLPHQHLGPEYVYTLSTLDNLDVTATLTIDGPNPPDLALMVIEEDQNGDCSPDNLVVYSDEVQDAVSNPPEVAGFVSVANTVYYLVVDGREAGSAGGYQLTVDCVIDCPPGLTDCDGVCVDLSSDVNNCGACGNACSFPHASASCVEGQCVMGPCDEGWYDCNLDPVDGCETDLVADNMNCGACGVECLIEQYCMGGKCVQECPDGFMDCGGGCIDVNGSDVNHCGGCDIVCQVANGVPACESGECGIESCDDGFADCVNGYADGCETVLGTDLNCADCDDACLYPNGYGLCQDGLCELGACENGFGNCNDDDSDGCETTLGSDDHCAACDDACEFDNADGFCNQGTCQMGDCQDGFGDCNQSPDDGCESEFSSDADNCGACGQACQADEICADGQCVFCVDADQDGYHDETCGGDDCDDSNNTIHPGAEEICHDGVDQDCDGDDTCGCADEDGDGYLDETCGGDDCDDTNGFISPEAPEVCGDGIDQDCDGSDLSCTCQDADSDGYPSAACGGSDCDDGNHFTHPGAQEACGDGIDQDCDGLDEKCADGCGCQTHSRGMPGIILALLVLTLARRRLD